MASTTFVATTREGNTVVRTSATREYTFVLLGTKDGQPEGALSWHGDKANADKAASTWSSRGMTTRVVPVEQTFTGKEARLVIEAAKAAPAETAPVEVTTTTTEEEIAVPTTTKPRARKAAAKKVVEPVVVEVPAEDPKVAAAAEKAAEQEAKAQAEATAATELEELLADLRFAQERVADLLAKRNNMIDSMITAGTISGPKIAKVMGVTPMAVYNMRAKATA